MKRQVSIAGQAYAVELNLAAQPPTVLLDGEPIAADLRRVDAGTVSLLLAGHAYTFYIEAGDVPGELRITGGGISAQARITDPRRQRREPLAAEGTLRLTAPMAGRVVRWLLAPGAAVTAGQGVLVLEAMKMQNEVRSPKPGRLGARLAEEGQAVGPGAPLAEIE